MRKIYLLRDDEDIDYRAYNTFKSAKEALIEYLDGLIDNETKNHIKNAKNERDEIFIEIYEKTSTTIHEVNLFG